MKVCTLIIIKLFYFHRMTKLVALFILFSKTMKISRCRLIRDVSGIYILIFPVRNTMFSVIFTLSQSHHFISSCSIILLSENRFLISTAGFPPTMEYGSTSLTTVALVAIIALLPTFIPGIMLRLRQSKHHCR